jgi:hypothetical protein
MKRVELTAFLAHYRILRDAEIDMKLAKLRTDLIAQSEAKIANLLAAGTNSSQPFHNDVTAYLKG